MNRTHTVRRILSILAALLLLITSLPACSGGVTREETKAAMDSLLTALAKEDYAGAAALYHPDAAMTEELLAAFAEEIRTNIGLDFAEGASVERTTNMRSAYYDSNVGGSFYALTAQIKVGDKTASLTVEVVRNDKGYGIFRVSCNP